MVEKPCRRIKTHLKYKKEKKERKKTKKKSLQECV